MMKTLNRLWILTAILFCSCSEFVYLPKSARQKYFARPHVQFMMAVVNFRETTGVWPSAVYQLVSHDEKNRKTIDDFQYERLDFVLRKDDRLVVYFDGYKKRLYLDEDEKIDLNRFRGNIGFYRSQGKFAWKVTMR